MLQGYVAAIPVDLEEAASMDGASRLARPAHDRASRCSRPGIVATAMFSLRLVLERVLLRPRAAPVARELHPADHAGDVHRRRGQGRARPARRRLRARRDPQHRLLRAHAEDSSPAACSPGRSRDDRPLSPRTTHSRSRPHDHSKGRTHEDSWRIHRCMPHGQRLRLRRLRRRQRRRRRRTTARSTLKFQALVRPARRDRRDRSRSSTDWNEENPDVQVEIVQAGWDGVLRQADHPVQRRRRARHHPLRGREHRVASPATATSPTSPTSCRTRRSSDISEGISTR